MLTLALAKFTFFCVLLSLRCTTYQRRYCRTVRVLPINKRGKRPRSPKPTKPTTKEWTREVLSVWLNSGHSHMFTVCANRARGVVLCRAEHRAKDTFLGRSDRFCYPAKFKLKSNFRVVVALSNRLGLIREAKY